MNETLIQCAAVFCASVAAGAINSVAGGGTLISFPTLMWVGLDSRVANMTNTMGLWPASLTGAWGFRHHKPPPGKLLLRFCLVSLAGGIVGAVLLMITPTKAFDAIVPWLILLAAVLFVLQERISQRFLPPVPQPGKFPIDEPERGTSAKALTFQFVVGVYGGYFGAGIGIMMLAALGMLQLGDIYRLNYLKNIGALLINIIAALLFGLTGEVHWPLAGIMIVGGIVGAFLMSGIARKIGPKALRAIVSLVGFTIAGVMLYKQFA
ncbi:MAG TPA: sulfite exporter TauE/SafE family protein [Planctomycetota bacterium]|nr:sulfite exporter TauE/SafE family protein [Planctomycetota bacterium]